MDPFRLDTTLVQDGTLTLRDLPFQAGVAVEITIVPIAGAAPTGGQPLQGAAMQYDRPTDSVAEKDWEISSDAEREAWLALSANSLAAAYGEVEDEYTLHCVKEANPDYEGR